VDEQRLKVKPINTSPPNPRMKNITYNSEQRGVGGGGRACFLPPPHPPHTKQHARLYGKKELNFLYKNM
jgi:hypothetical protein